MVLSNSQWLASSSTGADLVSVGNSALFDAGATSDGLSYTTDGSGFNQQTFTLSTWFYLGKRPETIGGVGWPIFASDHGSANSETTWWKIRINTNGTLVISNWNDVTTTQVFRDIGWYNLVIGADTTQVAAAERYRVYINGERITSFSSTGYPSQNIDLAWGEPSEDHWIGNYDSSAYAYNGYLAETVFKSGSQLGADSFGAYDSSGLYWTPKSSDDIKALSPTFYLDNATNPQTDASGNGVNWTNNGSIGTSLHSPTNSYPVQNPLTLTNSYPSSLANGNLKQTGNSGGSFASGTLATLPCDGGGKFYWEIKVLGTYTTNGYSSIGVAPMDLPRFDNTDGNGNFCLPGQQDYQGVSTTFNTGTTTNLRGNSLAVNSNIGSAYAVSTGAFMQIAFDSATQKVWFGKDNTWYNSGNPAAGSNETITLTATDKTWFPWIGTYTASDIFELNYGATDFEYTPPTGFNSLNTTQLASDTTRTASDTTKYFDTILYEGNGVGQRVGQFQPFTDSFTIAKSALFNRANEEYFSRTFETPTDQDVWTLSWWMKTGSGLAVPTGIMGGAASNSSLIYVTTANIYIYFNGGAGFVFDIDDPSQWQNIILTCNSGTLTCYWNGVSQGTASVTMGDFNSAVAHTVGSYNGDANWFDGYMADFVFVDGTVHSASVFGQTDTSSGRWVPKDPTTTLDEASDFGNNGFFLNFVDSSDMGNDVSGNNHDFTNNNTVTQTTDSPTTNITVLSPNRNLTGGTPSNGNRTIVTGSSQYGPIWTEMGLSSGKWYWEGVVTADTSASLYAMFGITTGTATSTTQQLGYLPYDIGYFSATYDGGGYYINNVKIAAIGDWTLNDVMGCALDFDAMTLTFYKNNTSKAVVKLPSEGPYYPAFCDWDNSSTCTWVTRFASADWSYSAPTDHIAITQDNMTSSDQFISAFSWIKNRDATDNHMLFDRVRGVYKDLHSNTTAIEVTNLDTVQQFLAGGVQVGNDVEVNTANESYVLWNWMMEATGTGSSNTDGTINTTSTLVDTTLGLSVSKYTGTGSNATVGHGLGVAPKMMLIKNLGVTDAWAVYYSDNTDYLVLNTNAATVDDATMWNDTTPTSSVFSIGSNHQVNASSENYIAYCFAPSQFISIGSYKGNANANGTFRPTLNSLGIPIQPVWVLIKNTASAQSWWIRDTVRNPYNIITAELHPDLNNAEYQSGTMDIVTGGLKQRSSSDSNADAIFVYMAIGTPIIDTDGRTIAGR